MSNVTAVRADSLGESLCVTLTWGNEFVAVLNVTSELYMQFLPSMLSIFVLFFRVSTVRRVCCHGIRSPLATQAWEVIK